MGARNSKAAAAAAGSAKVHGDDEEPHKHNKQEVEDLVYYATPLSIGMADLYDVMSVKIPKNATIPTMKFESRLTTVVDNQPNLKLAVYQGQRRKASANQLLGTLMFEGIPPAPKGAKVTTSFDIDTMGNLNVSVKDKTSGWKETKSIPGVGVKGKLQLDNLSKLN